MHPELIQTVAAEHVRDLRRQAAASRRARLARRTRRGRNAPASTAASQGAPVRILGAARHSYDSARHAGRSWRRAA